MLTLTDTLSYHRFVFIAPYEMIGTWFLTQAVLSHDEYIASYTGNVKVYKKA